jgi:hypothetical protein
MVSSSAAGFLGASAQSADARHPTANDAGLTSRWREPGSRMAPMKAAEIRPPEVVMWAAADTGS